MYVCLTMYDVVVGTRRHVSSLTCFILTWWKWRTKVFEGAVSVSNFKLIGHIFCTIFTNARSVFTLSFLYYLPFITVVASTRKRSVRSKVTSIRSSFKILVNDPSNKIIQKLIKVFKRILTIIEKVSNATLILCYCSASKIWHIVSL